MAYLRISNYLPTSMKKAQKIITHKYFEIGVNISAFLYLNGTSNGYGIYSRFGRLGIQNMKSYCDRRISALAGVTFLVYEKRKSNIET